MKTLERRLARIEQSRCPKLTPEERNTRLVRILKYGDPGDPKIKPIVDLLAVAQARRDAGTKPVE